MIEVAFETAKPKIRPWSAAPGRSGEMQQTARKLREIADLVEKGITGGAIRDASNEIIGTWSFR